MTSYNTGSDPFAESSDDMPEDPFAGEPEFIPTPATTSPDDTTRPHHHRPLYIPEGLERRDLDMVTAALWIAAGGLRPVPMTTVPTHAAQRTAQHARGAEGREARAAGAPGGGHKNPGGLLGVGWPDKTSLDPDVITAQFGPRPEFGTSAELHAYLHNVGIYRDVPFESLVLGIHIGPDVVVADIDDAAMVPKELWPELDAVPFQSTSHDDPRRGHYFFRTPDDGFFGQTSAIRPAPGYERSAGELRHGNAITVSAPSVHARADLGRRYAWIRTGPIPPMSVAMAAYLTSRHETLTYNGRTIVVSAASLHAIDAYVDGLEHAGTPELLDAHLTWMTQQADVAGLHNTWVTGMVTLAQMAACGYFRGDDAVNAAAQRFLEMRTDPARGGNIKNDADAGREFADILTWSFGKVFAKLDADTAAVGYETWRIVDTYYPAVAARLATPEAPPGYTVPAPSPAAPRTWYHPAEKRDDTGAPLVRSMHMLLAEALGEHCAELFRFVVADSCHGDWWSYDARTGLWDGTAGAEKLRGWISQAVRPGGIIAPYVVVERGKAAKEIPEDVLDRLEARYGKTGVFHHITDRPAYHMPEIDALARTLGTIGAVHARHHEFDDPRRGVAVANGVLDPLTRVLAVPDPSNRLTGRMPVPYVPGATAPNFLAFLRASLTNLENPQPESHLDEVIRLLQKYWGMALIGDRSSDRFLVAHGPGGSGKSTIFEKIPRELFGITGSGAIGGGIGSGSGLWSTVSPRLFTQSIGETPRKFELATVTGARLLTCNEGFDTGGAHLDVGFLKGFVDGSMQKAAYKGRDNFDMVPGHVVFLTNREPRLAEIDSALHRRMVVLEFPNAHDASDPFLPPPDEKLFERDLLPELPGILNWILDGVDLFRAEGLAVPSTILENTKTMLAEASPAGRFLAHLRPVTAEDPRHVKNAVLSSSDLYNLYRDWLSCTSSRGTREMSFISARKLLADLKTTYPNVRTGKATGLTPDGQRWFRLDNGERSKSTPVTGITAREDLGAFLAVSDAQRDAAPSSGHNLDGSLRAVPRDRIGIPEVEEWRARQNPANIAGTPLRPNVPTTE